MFKIGDIVRNIINGSIHRIEEYDTYRIGYYSFNKRINRYESLGIYHGAYKDQYKCRRINKTKEVVVFHKDVLVKHYYNLPKE